MADGAPRTALITGASSGIGASFARQLAARGYRLILVARREERLNVLARELLRNHQAGSEVWVADLAIPTDLQRVACRIVTQEGLELLINNAGFGLRETFDAISPGKAMDMIRVHLLATVSLTRAALPRMLDAGRGGVISVSSIAAFLPLPGSSVYAASKSFLNTFTQTLHQEVGHRGVRVQALCPGYTRTGFHETPEYGDFDRDAVPSWMWMTADEVVKASLRALRRGQVICIPGMANRWIVRLSRMPFGERVIQRWARRARPPVTVEEKGDEDEATGT